MKLKLALQFSFFVTLIVLGCFTSLWQASIAASNDYTLSIQRYALTANAGGQEAWSLRLSRNDSEEISIFANEYLRTGEYPLFGATYDLRYVICGRYCPIRSFAQIGIGASSAGPTVELLWSLTPLWLLRIDFTTHIYFIPYRAIVWNYPFWVGLSVPF